VGVYQVVYPLATLLTLALSAFGFLTMPVLSEHHAEGRDEEFRGLYRTLSKWVFATSLPVLLVYLVLPRTVIGVTFGQEYVEGALALAVLAVGFGSHAVVGPNTNALTSLGHSRLVMYDSVGAALSNVALNVVLVPRYGIVGAAAATTVSYVLVNGLMSAQLYRLAGIQPFSRGLVALGVAGTLAFPPVLVAVDAVLAVTGLPGLFALAFTYGVTYLLLAALVGVGEDELRIVGDIERRFGVDLWVVRRLARLGPGAPD
jgi:O-antigen/teichoic acid export membrane protein